MSSEQSNWTPEQEEALAKIAERMAGELVKADVIASFSIACSLYAILLSRRAMRTLQAAALARRDFVVGVAATDWPAAREAAARYSSKGTRDAQG
ncbi:hypothetical protein [Sphingomonas sp. ABOLF]|uniref:hypothetical protein n=1 Tax=Sphingomonas sp. ABOLF TaxID=1985879 RepID=UPI000F7E62F7|nr:hypothetical protein [Sphingomonas sp. ABOLF]